MFYTSKFGKCYLKSIEVISRPFVKMNRFSVAVQKKPVLYTKLKKYKPVLKLIAKMRACTKDSPQKDYFVTRAAMIYITGSLPESLANELKLQIERLRESIKQEDEEQIKELINKMVSSFQLLQTTT